MDMAKPIIRFKGYQDDWEQRKLGDVAQEFKSGTSLKADEIDITGDYPVYGGNGLRGYTSTYNHDGEYALIGRQGALCGNMNYSVGKAYFTEHAVVVKADENNDTMFLYYMLDTMNLGQYSDQSAQPGLAVNKLVKLENWFPTKEEQQRIGWYFSNLDHLITLHQRKCDETKKLKKYMLQKMFPQNGEKVPEIRFSGFTDDWEQRKFADFTWDAGKRNKEDLDLEPYAITNEHGFIRQRDAHDDFGYMKDTDRKAYNIVQPNSFAYNPARINVGSIGYYKGVENVIVSSLYEVFQTDNYVNDRFLWHWLKSDEFPRWIEKLQEGSVRLYFYYDKLCECQLYMPSLEEQEKIASFLDGLDHLITLHQRKCDETKKLKKYMLQKMFPQNGSKVPEIRLKGFTDEWEQRKLGNVAQEFKSGNSLKADEIDITGDYPVYGGNGLRGYTSTYNHDGEYALIGRQGALCGNMNYSAGKAYFTEHAVVVKADENNDTSFLYYMLDTMNLGQYSDQSAQPGLAVNKLVKLENSFPKKEEQQQIGTYFRSLDDLVTLHQHKCEELKKLKKFMLQNMFI